MEINVFELHPYCPGKLSNSRIFIAYTGISSSIHLVQENK
jgi:hypothetical protein